MKKRLLLLTTVILFLATIAVRASYSYFYTENLSSPTWSNWTATPYYTGGTGPSSEYYSPGGYGGITGYGWMMYNTPHWGGGEVSMTYRVATTAGDSFTAYLGSVDTTLATGNYDQVLVALSGGWGSDINVSQFWGGVQTSLGTVSGVSIPDGSVIRAVGIPNSSGGDTIAVYVNNELLITVSGPRPNIDFSTYWGVGAFASDPTDGNVMSSVSLGYQDTIAPTPVSNSSIGQSAYYNAVDLTWAATTDDINGTGVYDYSIYRNGAYVGSTQSLSYADTAGITPSTTYSYTLVATDYHLNSASTTFSVTTPAILTSPPYPSATPEGRRVGVRATGAYWGASGENIDMLSGNLSFSQPLLSAQGRNGWSVGFNLIYNSQNWRKDSGGTWEFGADTGFGYGWRIMAGSITPVWNTGGLSAAYYIYVDSSGAEYRLDQDSGNIWSSKESIYVWFDANANILHNRDGSFWNFGCISAATEPDAGVMYPTVIEDTNGSQVKITYQTAPGASWSNSSSRITLIEDVRATDPLGVYSTYSFSYNTDSPPHLTTITNGIGTGENYSFTYNSGTLYDPFATVSHGTTTFLSRAIITNIGTYYQFTTDSAGELTKIQLPYKGYLAYSYVTTTYGDGRSFREVLDRYLSADGSTQTTYSVAHESSPGYDVHQFTVLDDPGGAGEKYWAFAASGTYEALASTYESRDRGIGGPGNCVSGSGNGSGACVNENDFTWTQDSTGNSYIGTALTTMDPGHWYTLTKQSTQTVDIHGNVTEAINYNYSGFSPAYRKYDYSYLSSGSYPSLYIFNRLTSSALTDGTTSLTMASVAYDCTSGCYPGGSGSPREWDTSYGSVQWRGNPTSMTDVSGNSTTVTYDLYGDAVSTTSNGVTSSSTVSSATNYAAPSQISVGSLTADLTYNTFLGVTAASGPNGASVSLGYDTNARPTSSTSAYGATTYTVYNDTASPPNSCTMVNGRWTQTNVDGLGRPILTLTGHGSSCGTGTILTQAETNYESCGCSPLGKMYQQAVPHAYGTGPSAMKTYYYDGVGRTLGTSAGGTDTVSNTYFTYAINQTQASDAAYSWKNYTMDAFGNLTQVIEPNPSGGANYYTTYTYDLLNHLTGVSMARTTGTQTRSFVFSGNRLTSTANPENGTVSYTYNSYGKVATKTDAKGQEVVYSYDSLARLSEVQRYPTSGTEDVCQREVYYYDGNSPSSSSYPQYASGRLSAVQYWGGYNPGVSPTCDTTFTEMYTYGSSGAPAPVGKQLQVTRTLQWPSELTSVTKSVALIATFTYDNEGRLTEETYPTDNAGTTADLSYTFDSMGRLNTMTDNIAGKTLITGAAYGPANEVTSITGGSYLGAWSGETRSYNSLKQLTGLVTGSVNMSYAYPATGNNGKLSSQTDAVSGETVTYTYNTLNQLATAANQSTFTPLWGQSFAYDGFGNLTSTGVTQGSAPTMSASYDGNNHAGGEDANGNPGSIYLPAASSSYAASYDVENRLIATGSGAIRYSYAPGNKRVWRGVGTWDSATGQWSPTDEVTFWSVSGRKMATYQLTTSLGVGPPTPSAPVFYATQTACNYYFGGKLIKNGNGWVYSDHLGSMGKFYPYGVERPSATANGTEKFTGYFRDAETGNDYAMNRYESPGGGRFLTADTVDGDPSAPGSWNKYAYVQGDPINQVDPDGRDPNALGGGDDIQLGDCFEVDSCWAAAFNDPMLGYTIFEVSQQVGNPCSGESIASVDPDCLAYLYPSVFVENPAPAPPAQPSPPRSTCSVATALVGIPSPCIINPVLPIVPVGFGNCEAALANLTRATARLVEKTAEWVANVLGLRNANHRENLEIAIQNVKNALTQVNNACGTQKAAAAAIAAAGAAIAAAEAALSTLASEPLPL